MILAVCHVFATVSNDMFNARLHVNMSCDMPATHKTVFHWWASFLMQFATMHPKVQAFGMFGLELSQKQITLRLIMQGFHIDINQQ